MWRAAGFAMLPLMSGAMGLILLLLVTRDKTVAEILKSVSVIGTFFPIMFGMSVGLAYGHLEKCRQPVALHLATRPMSDADLARVLVRGSRRTTFFMWIWCVSVLAGMLTWLYFRVGDEAFRQGWRTQIDSSSPFGNWLILILAAGSLGGTLACSGVTLSLVLTGRPRLISCVFFLVFVQFFVPIIRVFPSEDIRQRVLSVWAWSIGLAAVGLTVWLFLAARRGTAKPSIRPQPGRCSKPRRTRRVGGYLHWGTHE